ncbi:thiopeptide-type bacteriocin biosynthesis domain-containing protein [Chryseobacterium soldanellicola]|uniref:Thiopeptide-type bacteriocin biosynthesis domain-containing protein n=1 Tax=Chryseobacterium soldanellicola TaxID=311333 RepID=A0A1H0ZNU5_9FLAO|nr:thiopeptide-type bacteriocin biosynthesis protein [Chryseobacterium soldanellicola]SDQ29198.1 thiopeptide-type bacteriocin biosynthesis domain-containing protein [Chryseobacterium soldanellicola]
METTRKFPPGSEWLYIKVYTGIKTADIILEEVIKPLTENLQQENCISKWFFIRYNDPKPHIRLRFELINSEDNDSILIQIHESLKEFVASGEISNYVVDTYNREIERYGTKTMVFAEKLFHINSKFTLECLQLDDEEKIIATVFYIEQLLDQLNLSINEKLEWIKDFNLGFKKEFNADKKLNSQLDKKYRNFIPKYFEFFESNDYLEFRNLIISTIEESENVLGNIVSKSSDSLLPAFFQSIFHLNINRMFVSHQRLFEMIIYDYLHRHYKKMVFQNKMD